MMNGKFFNRSFHQVRRIFIALIGFTVLILGIALTVLPGPAILVIPLAFAILATEFVWARKTLKRIQHEVSKLKTKLNSHS
jgi:tellurite resistance protein TerC